MKAAVSTQTTMCSHCEEVVHRYAVRCPYCNKNLKNSTTTSSHDIAPPEPVQSKITQMPQSAFYANDLLKDAMLPIKETEEKPQISNEVKVNQMKTDDAFGKEMKKVLVPLVSLLTGAFFFFFGVILKLFSSNGTFTLEWNASAWPFFVFPAFLLLLVGMVSLPKDPPESDAS